MSVNKRWVKLSHCILALKEGNLKDYYGKSDILYFEDNICSLIYTLYTQGKTNEEIIDIIKKNENYE